MVRHTLRKRVVLVDDDEDRRLVLETAINSIHWTSCCSTSLGGMRRSFAGVTNVGLAHRPRRRDRFSGPRRVLSCAER